jgi:hypothetical protein
MTKRIVALAMLCATSALLLSSTGICQFTEEENGVRKTQTLAGVVRIDGSDSDGIKGVLVEDCSSDWKRVIASTETDESGHFSLPNAQKAGLHYLRFSMYAVRTRLVKARIVKKGPKELSVGLNNAT